MLRRPVYHPAVNRVSIIVAATFAAVMAATTVSTPLYPDYVREFGVSSLEVTVIFAAYGAGVMCGLALFGRLSDHYGRKPPLAGALVVGIVAMVVFLAAQGLGALLLGRALIGLTAGVYTGTCTAWLVDLDTDRVRATKLAIAANLGGLGLGPLIAGALAAWAPHPLRLVYAVELVAMVVGLALHTRMTETVRRERFQLDFASLRPPREVMGAYVPAAIAAIAAFGTSGVFGSTGPSMLGEVFGVHSPAWAGLLLGAAFAMAVLGQMIARLFEPARALTGGCVGLAVGVAALGLALQEEILASLVASSVLTGLAMGVIVGAGLGLLTAAAPPERRGQIASAYFLAAYIGLVVPVIGFGLVESSQGLVNAGLVFSALVGVVSLACAVVVSRYRPAQP